MPDVPDMNDRQRFLATMHYQPRDRAPICDFGFWPDTIDRWHAQGLAQWVEPGNNHNLAQNFFGMDLYTGGPNVNVGLHPPFPTERVEDRGEQEVIRDGDGVLLLRDKYSGSIPVHLDHTLKDRASWEEHFEWRLDPNDPKRLPDLDDARRCWDNPDYPRPRTIFGGSLFGWVRNWMGVEGVSYLVYDDPALFERIIDTIANLIVEMHRKMLEMGAKIDACSMWEDMCYNAGPLLGVEHFKQYLVPRYRRITDQLRAHGCRIVWLDCDGNIEQLMPHWLEAGVNCMFPIEIGTWGADPVKYRKQYGKALRMMGGFDKHILARGPDAIDAEIERLAPLVAEGGFIPFCDHRVPPDVPLAHYMHYLERARAVWAGNHPTLKPIGALQAPRTA
jgi:uroporphyrinogen decarboxylase